MVTTTLCNSIRMNDLELLVTFYLRWNHYFLVLKRQNIKSVLLLLNKTKTKINKLLQYIYSNRRTKLPKLKPKLK